MVLVCFTISEKIWVESLHFNTESTGNGLSLTPGAKQLTAPTKSWSDVSSAVIFLLLERRIIQEMRLHKWVHNTHIHTHA